MKKILSVLSVLLLSMILVACGNNESNGNTDGFDTSAAIKVYTRDTTSGTRDAFFSGIGFKDAVSSNEKLVTGFVEVDGNGTMRSGVAGDTLGIGYVSLSSLNDTVKPLMFNGVAGSVANVNNNTYDLKRPFMFVTRYEDSTEEPADDIEALVRAFVAFSQTQEGKAAIQSQGGILEIRATDKTWDDIKADHPVTTKDNSELTIRFGGSTSVEAVSKALTAAFSPLAGNFNAVHEHTGSGDAVKRTWGSEKDAANSLHVGFASRDFNQGEKDLFGNAQNGRLNWDAVVAVVHPTNPLSNISAEQLVKIYDGTFTKWSDLID